MREIKNNVEIGKPQQVRTEVKPDEAKKAPQPVPETKPEVVDFSNPKAEALGRSQVSKADALEKDVNFGMKNPDAIESADRFFDMAYNQLLKEGDPEAYPKACERASFYVADMHK